MYNNIHTRNEMFYSGVINNITESQSTVLFLFCLVLPATQGMLNYGKNVVFHRIVGTFSALGIPTRSVRSPNCEYECSEERINCFNVFQPFQNILKA